MIFWQLEIFRIHCNSALSGLPTSTITQEEAIQEIYAVEQAFNDLFTNKGKTVAFSHFATEDGGILRNGERLKGYKFAIKGIFHTASERQKGGT